MVFRNFEQLVNSLHSASEKKRCAVIAAESIHSLEAVEEARKTGILSAALFGTRKTVLELLNKANIPSAPFEIVNCASPEESLQRAIAYVRDGGADFLLKGQIDTNVLMKGLLKENSGLRGSSVVHSVAFAEIETYHKLIAMTDGAILLNPTVAQKKEMIKNTVKAMRNMGWVYPKVAVLAATEKVNPAMQATVDAHELKLASMRGELESCIADGPMAFDLAISKEAAELKGFESIVAGDADLMIFPDINSGNIGIKVLTMTGHNKTGSVVLGLKVPVVMASRGAAAENKLRGIILAAAMS